MIPLRGFRTPKEIEPNAHSAIQYILLGRPLVLSAEILARFPSRQRPSFSEIQKLAGKDHLHTTDEDIVLFIRNPTPAHYSLRPAGRAAWLLGDEPMYSRAVTDAPLDHASLPLDCFLLPRHGAHPSVSIGG